MKSPLILKSFLFATLIIGSFVFTTSSCNTAGSTLSTDKIVKLDIVKDYAPADKLSYSVVKITVDSTIDPTKKTVTCQLSPMGEFPDGTKSYTTTIDVSGNAYVYVRSSQAGTTILTIKIGDYTRNAELHFSNVTNTSNSILQVSLLRDSIVADNNAYAELTVISLDSDVIRAQPDVALTILDNGVFSSGNKTMTTPLNSSGRITAYLKNDRPTLSHLKISLVSGTTTLYSKDTFVHFITSWPDNITINAPGSISASSPLTAKATVTAQYVRSAGGSPSTGLLGYFKAFKENDDSIGLFFNSTSIGSDLKSSSDFWLIDTSYRGFVKIKEYLPTDKYNVSTNRFDTIIGTTQILIVN